MQLDDTTIEFLDDVLRRFHPSVMNEHTTVSVGAFKLACSLQDSETERYARLPSQNIPEDL